MMRSEEELETSYSRNADDISSVTTDPDPKDVAKESRSKVLMEERFTFKMFFYGCEIICFCIAITFTLVALHSIPPRISKSPSAKPFFSPNSSVIDFYKGHLGAMVEQITNSHFSFIMYYAPWDAESQTVRHEFEAVANYYRSQITFIAINCWHPRSECRIQYNKFQNYPVLMIYPSRDSGIQYKGIRTAPYMIRFLNSFLNPIIRINNDEEVEELLMSYDAVVVGYFKFNGVTKTPGYREFYKSATSSLERYPNRQVIFAASINPINAESRYSVFKYPSATLLMWNESLRYPENNIWTSESIVNWISNSLHQPCVWLQPGNKASTLAPYVLNQPALVLFTPRNPYQIENYNYNLLREVSFQYHDCTDDTIVKDVTIRLEKYNNQAVARFEKKSRNCMNEDKVFGNGSTQSFGDSMREWIDDNCDGKITTNKCLLYKTSTGKTEGSKARQVCRESDIFKISSKSKNYQHGNEKSKKSSFDPRSTTISTVIEDDPQSTCMIRKADIKENCRMWSVGNKFCQPIFPVESHENANENITNIVCKKNRTLSFVVIDTLQYFYLAESLGIDILSMKNKTAAVILDSSEESYYVMNQDFGKSAFVQFINNYTKGLLERTLRSERLKNESSSLKTKNKCPRSSDKRVKDNEICVIELTTATFLETVLNPKKDVIVMYYSSYCAFCSAISYVYLTVAHYFREMNSILFTRVNGDRNDLPWEYHMNRFPSILFFPARRKEYSTVFPFSIPITIPNLLNFILANLDGDLHVEALVNICQLGFERPDKCIRRIRWFCLDIIEKLVRDYRKLRRHSTVLLDKKLIDRKQRIILLQLRHIRDIHLVLGSTNDLSKNQRKVQLIRQKFRKYYEVMMLLNSTDSFVHKKKFKTLEPNRVIKDEL